MGNADRAKLLERALSIGLISMGLTSLAGILITEGFGIFISVVFGLAMIGMVIVGVPRKIVNVFQQRGLQFAISGLAILVPLGAFILLAFYPAGFGVAMAIGASFPADVVIAMVISAMAATINLIVFFVNTAGVLRSRGTSERLGQ